MSDPSLLYAWRCDECGERQSVLTSDDAAADAEYHRVTTHHERLFTIGPEGETPA